MPRDTDAGPRGALPRVVLADDHQLFAEGLASLLADDYDVVAIVGDGLSLLEAVEAHAPDLVFADVSMPGLNGVECARKLTESAPRVGVLLLTMHEDAHLAAAALRAGAAGYVLKHGGAADVLDAAERALSGGVFVSAGLVDEVDSLLAAPRGADRELTPRQLEIVGMLAQGLLAKEIAERLGLSRRTVEFHKYEAMERLGIRSNAELFGYAMKHGIGPI